MKIKTYETIIHSRKHVPPPLKFCKSNVLAPSTLLQVLCLLQTPFPIYLILNIQEFI